MGETTEAAETRARVAYHEAGHLVAADVLGRDAWKVWISDELDTIGHWNGRTDADYSVASQEEVARVAIIRVAGPIAERRHVTGEYAAIPDEAELITLYGGVSDFREMRAKAGEFGSPEWSDTARKDAARVIEEHWSDVERWAARIENEGTIDLPRRMAGGWLLANIHYDSREDALAGKNGVPRQQWLDEQLKQHRPPGL